MPVRRPNIRSTLLSNGLDLLRTLLPVSRETGERLQRYVALLRDWQRAKNLVADETLSEVWPRHICDSAQLVALAPEAHRWLDLGSGAGFPGIVTAILLADVPGARVDLVESNHRKAAFLRTVARETGAPAFVHAGRIDDVMADWDRPVDAVSARALANFATLLGWTAPLLSRGAVAHLHKGENFREEREAAAERWTFDLIEHPSRFGPGAIIEVRSAKRRP